MECHTLHRTRPQVSILIRQPFGSQRPRKVELRGLSPVSQIAGIPPACLNIRISEKPVVRTWWRTESGAQAVAKFRCVERKVGSILDQASPQAQPPEPTLLAPRSPPPETIPLISQGGHRLHTATTQPARLPQPPLPRTQRRLECQVMVLSFQN